MSGRVVPEFEASASSAAGMTALNEQSVLLEGSREASGGVRVRLDLSQLPFFRIFPGQVRERGVDITHRLLLNAAPTPSINRRCETGPGRCTSVAYPSSRVRSPALSLAVLQVVGVKGLNPTGSVFVAQQLVTHVPAAPRQQQQQAQERDGGGDGGLLSMVVAAGPFTTSDNVQYEPLDELLKYCTGESLASCIPPHRSASRGPCAPASPAFPAGNDVGEVMLMGPFVDVEHPSVKDGSLDVTFEQLFREQVCACFRASVCGGRCP